MCLVAFQPTKFVILVRCQDGAMNKLSKLSKKENDTNILF